MKQCNNVILIHYSEIALKGKNRKFFENKLIQNIKAHLKIVGNFNILKLHDRILVNIDSNIQITSYLNALNKVFGIANFALTYPTKLDLKEIREQALELAKKEKFQTFAIRAERSNKKFKYKSPEIEKQLGAYILKELPDKKVNLTKPNLTIYIEIIEKQALTYTKKIKGPSGLPTSSSGKIISLISGGIDSPVASYLLMKRGCQVIFTHFHSYPQTSQESISQVKKLVKILNQYQLNSKLYLIPLLNIQKQIIANCPQKLRVILYRRMMIRLANQIAEKENAKALLTGDSVGQVASQTLENIQAISQASNLPILRPLAGFNKQEIINLAEKIKTYQTSIQPFPDCCSLFIPKHPETKAKLPEIIKSEQVLNIKELISQALNKTKIIK